MADCHRVSPALAAWVAALAVLVAACGRVSACAIDSCTVSCTENWVGVLPGNGFGGVVAVRAQAFPSGADYFELTWPIVNLSGTNRDGAWSMHGGCGNHFGEYGCETICRALGSPGRRPGWDVPCISGYPDDALAFAPECTYKRGLPNTSDWFPSFYGPTNGCSNAMTQCQCQCTNLTSTSTVSATTSTSSSASSGPTTTTTTTTRTSTTGGIEEQISDKITKVLSGLVAKLGENGQTSITESGPEGIRKVATLDSLFDASSNETSPEPPRAVLDFPEADVSVGIPLSFVDHLPPGMGPEDVVIGVSTVDRNSEEFSQSGLASTPYEDGTPATVEAVMVLKFLGRNGTSLTISGLAQPIEFTMRANYTERSSCSYLNEDLQRWSNKGVSESPENQVGEQIVCLTDHLTVFGALLRGISRAIICSQVSLLNSEGIGNLVSGDWHVQMGAVFQWCAVAASFVLFAVAVVIDESRTRRGLTWSPEFFLFAEEPEPGARKEEPGNETVDDASEASVEKPKQGVVQGVLNAAVCGCLGFVLAACTCFKDNVARDVLDEIMSEWFDKFSEVRSCLEGCWEGLEIGSFGVGNLLQISRSAMCHVTLSSARRLAGSSLCLTDEAVKFVLEDEDLQELLVTKHRKRDLQELLVTKYQKGDAACTPGGASFASTFSGGSVQTVSHLSLEKVHQQTSSGKAATPASTREVEPRPRWWTCPHHEEAWSLLHAEVSETVQRHINTHDLFNLPRIVLRILIIHNPIGAVFCHDIFFNCKIRSFFHALELHGSLLVIAVFFAATGGRGRRSSIRAGGFESNEPDECNPAGEEVFYYVGRALVVAFGSVLLAGLPVIFLQSLHTRSFKTFEIAGSAKWRRQLRAWYFQDGLIWTIGSLYLCFGTFFVFIFLANVSNADQNKFAQTALLCVIQNTFVMPFVVALFVPTTAGTLLHLNGSVSGGRESALREVHCKLYSKTNAMLPLSTV